MQEFCRGSSAPAVPGNLLPGPLTRLVALHNLRLEILHPKVMEQSLSPFVVTTWGLVQGPCPHSSHSVSLGNRGATVLTCHSFVMEFIILVDEQVLLSEHGDTSQVLQSAGGRSMVPLS